MEARLTLPIETGIDREIRELMDRLGVDAVRNSDGTELPDWVSEGIAKVYSTYFPARGDKEWEAQSAGERVCQFLMSDPVTASSADPLEINVMRGYLPAQFRPDTDCDRAKYWQVIDRTTGRTLAPEEWSVVAAAPLPLVDPVAKVGEYPAEAASAIVTIAAPEPFHSYTVNFLAQQVWDSTQMYNYLTNDWADDPKRTKDQPYDVAYHRTWEHVRSALARWLQDHPEVDVVRFTTFFYHFTLVFDDRAREKYVDWFGYSASVSIPALEKFAQQYGYELTPEDFVDGGHYNTPFRLPTKRFRDWIDFTSREVAAKAGELVREVHEAGREAMMFLGDNWMGMEPYGPHFPAIGLDAVVGSVGSAATCRMIADIPGVKYTEGRFLPYFFPDVFNPEGDPVKEANDSWLTARRAIVRHPLDRIGYGGYLSLALKHPDFIDRMEAIVREFRSLHTESGGARPANARPVVAVLNAWGKLRTWQTHMVAHALWYKQIYSYLGVIESLAGLPFDVRFLSFDEVLETGIPADVSVLINAGTRDTAFSGGQAWADPRLQTAVREFVWRGGGLVGVGEPTAASPAQGPFLALADVFGVDREIGWTLSHTRHPVATEGHFVTTDLQERFDFGEDPGEVVPLGATVLAQSEGSVRIAVHAFGSGRAVYLAGLPYSPQNSRLLHRSLLWAAGAEAEWASVLASTNPQVEVAYYPDVNRCFVYNNTDQPAGTHLTGPGVDEELELAPMEGRWLDL